MRREPDRPRHTLSRPYHRAGPPRPFAAPLDAWSRVPQLLYHSKRVSARDAAKRDQARRNTARSPGRLCSLASRKEERQWQYCMDPFDALSSFQQALDAYRTSTWLDAGLSGGGAYPPLNVFRKGDDFIIIAELPGVKKSDLEVQVKGRTHPVGRRKTVGYPEKAALHRRERLAGRFDRAVTMPVEINPDGVKAEYRDGILRFVSAARREREAEVDQGGVR